jgi:CRP/FNR family transcriptional regulator
MLSINSHKEAIIQSIPLFKGLTDAQVTLMKDQFSQKTFKRNEVIFFEGDPAHGFYVVAEGKVKIYKMAPDGKEKILHIYGPGNPFGEVPVFSGGRFPANAMALIQSRFFYISREAFINAIELHPSLSLNMLGELSKRLREFTVQIENLALKEVPARLATYLIYLTREQQNNNQVTLTISKGQLASLLGTIPETLSRIFNRMSTQRLIDVQGQTIQIQNFEELLFLAENGRFNDG